MGNGLSVQDLQSQVASTIGGIELNQLTPTYVRVEHLQSILNYVSEQLALGTPIETIHADLVRSGALPPGSEEPFFQFISDHAGEKTYTMQQVKACLLTDDVEGCLEGSSNMVGQRGRHDRRRPPPRPQPIFIPQPVRMCDPTLAPFCTVQEAQAWLRRFGYM